MTNVMLVDDYEIFRKQLKRLKCWKDQTNINLQGEADNGLEALRFLRNNHVDILLTDIKMPKMNGLELLKYVKSEELCKCVILLSEYADFEYARKGIVLGAFDYIVKPVKEESLDKVLGRAMKYIDDSVPEENIFNSECEIIAETIINSGTKLENLLKDITIKCRRYAEDDFVRGAVMLSEVTRQIYNLVVKKKSKISMIIGNVEETCKLIIQTDDWFMSAAVFEKYMMDIYAAIKNYYPSNMSGLSETVVNYIFDHMFEKMTLTDISDVCFISNTYLSHSFKKNMGRSFVDYVTLLKMQVVKKFLTETDWNITEIAEKLGYDDCKYMGRIFKNMFGFTLSDYRRMNRVYLG